MHKVLKKEDLNKFLNKLKRKAELIAPVKTDTLRFEKIDDVSKIHLDGLPLFSIKKYLLPSKEEMFRIEHGKLAPRKEKVPERIIFGVKKCDLGTIPILDKLFIDAMPDPYYIERRNKTTLIGIHCAKVVDEYCFCESMNVPEFYDLYFVDMGDKYYIEVGTEKGRVLVSRLEDYKGRKFKILTPKCASPLKRYDMNPYRDSNIFDEDARKCFSCTACNTLCPTCLCFGIEDELDLNLKTGKRERRWAGCLSYDFTRVAGNHVFRQERIERFKHRIYHKIQYFKEKFGIDMCTGCGRCIKGCPVRIDWVTTINAFKG